MKILKEICQYIVESKNSDNIIVEGFGTPGAGKSFVCNKFKNNLEKNFGFVYYHSIDNYNNSFLLRTIKKLTIIIRHIIIAPSLVCLVFLLLSKFKNIKGIVKLKLIFNFLFVISIIKKRKNLLIMDQGIFQSIWSCYYYNNFNNIPNNDELINVIEKILNKLFLKKLIVFDILAENLIILSRLKKRKIKGTSALNNFDKTVLDRGYNATILSRALVYEMSLKSKNLKVFKIKN